MSSVGHPARKRARLRELFKQDRVVTSVQLSRWGLLETADSFGLPHRTYTLRTRSTQASSAVDLTFYAGDSDWLSAAPRDLMHWATIAEGRHKIGCLYGQELVYVDLGGRDRADLPDAELLQSDGSPDWAVEADAGYSKERIVRKIVTASRAGYGRLAWLTTVHARTTTLPTIVEDVVRSGLPGTLRAVDIYFVDFWSQRDPYHGRPRCHKPMRGSALVVRHPGIGSTNRRIRP